MAGRLSEARPARLWPAVVLVVALLGAFGMFRGAYAYFRGEEAQTAAARLSLYRSTVVAELQRFGHLSFVLARDPYVIATAEGGDTDAVNRRLAAFAERAGLDAIFLMDTRGVTRAASNAGTPQSFVGQDYSFRPYFQAAMQGRQGQFYGIGTTTGLPGYFYADPVLRVDGTVIGVVALKIDLTPLQDSWQTAGERVLLANADGVALLASEPAWRYRALAPLSAVQRRRIAEARQFQGQALPVLDWQPEAGDSARIDGRRLIHLQTGDLPNGWSLHYFASDDRAVGRAWLVTGSFLLLAGAAFIAVQTRRTRRIGAALRRSEQEEAQLRLANERLAVEIEERRAAERRLQRTQSELERAGRLAALGRLAASVTHELGQPIAAMKNQLAVAEMQGTGGPVVERLAGLVDRMEGITRQLKFFSRKGRDAFEDVDLGQAMRAALDLVAPNIAEGGVAVRADWPGAPVIVHGNRLRLEQVMVNLLRNAVQAVAGEASPAIELRFGAGRGAVWFEVADNGHGLGGQSLADLAEPFATTRESGQGMGLGLTISAGIVSDHGGQMDARDRETGGAVFRVTLPSDGEDRT